MADTVPAPREVQDHLPDSKFTGFVKEYDKTLFRSGFELVHKTSEGQRILRALKGHGTEVEFRKFPLAGSEIDGTESLGKTEFPEGVGAAFAWVGALPDATVKIDLDAVQRATNDSKLRIQVMAYLLFHEFRHAEAKADDALNQRTIDRDLDFYLYPSLDDSERKFQSQAKLPLHANENGRALFQW
jgi:hypothetical protein